MPAPGPGTGAGETGDDEKGADQLGPLPGWYAIDVDSLHRPLDRYGYFLKFEPVAMAGYSVYIYHISVEDANRVRRELGLPRLTPSAARPDTGSR